MAKVPIVKVTFGLRHNIIANFAGKAWLVLMNLAFMPLYLKFMGIEAYGLVGIFVSLTVLLSVLDLGLSTTVNRELARLSATSDNAKAMRDTVRTFEILYWIIGTLLGGGVAALSPLIARYWLNSQGLPVSVVTQAVMLMGLLIAFQWPTALYSGGLLGLQRQVLLNMVIAAMATLKGVGAVLVLALFQPTIQAFFTWQILVTAVLTFVLAICLWQVLPAKHQTGVFRKKLLMSNWRFATGMMGISIVVAILTQLDKVILSRQLTLEMFGYYSIASAVGVGLSFLASPVFSALFPHFTQLVSEGRQSDLTRLYHRACQLVSIIVLPISIVVILFAPEVLSLWLRDPTTVQNTRFLFSLIAAGTTLNSLVSLPYALQLAHGWTKLSFYKNVVSVIILVPLMNLFILWWGAVGAAIAWILLNAGYLLIEVPIMHTHLLRGSMARWYLVDVGLPSAIILSIVGAARWLFPGDASMSVSVVWILLTFLLALCCSVLALPATREWAQKGVVDFGSSIQSQVRHTFGAS